MSTICKSETQTTIAIAGNSIVINNTTETNKIVDSNLDDNDKIGSILTYLHTVSKINNLIKDNDLDQIIYDYYVEMYPNDFSKIGQLEYQPEILCMAAIDHWWKNIKYIKNKTPAICTHAIINPRSIKYMETQLHDLCMAAVMRDGMCLKFIKNKHSAICRAALHQNAEALQYVDEQTKDMCIFAVEKNSSLIKYVKNQTEEICNIAFKENIRNFMYIHNPTIEMYKTIIKNNSSYYLSFLSTKIIDITIIKELVILMPSIIQYFNKQTLTEEICLLALSLDPTVIQFVVKKTRAMCLEIIKNENYDFIRYFSGTNDIDLTDIYLPAVTKNGLLLMHIPDAKKTDEIIRTALSQNGLALQYCPNPSYNYCEIALRENGLALNFIFSRIFGTTYAKLCKLAVINNPLALSLVEKAFKSEKLCILAVNSNGLMLEFVLNKTYEICKVAIINNPMSLKFVIDQTDDLCILAVQSNGLALQFVKDKTTKICYEAILNDKRARAFIPGHF